MNAESTTSLSKRFTSYERSAQTGLDYAINRTYDSKQGRFTQVDPIGMGASSLGSPQTLNLYTYCGNDPINYTDPSGLFFGSLFKWIGKIFKAINKILKWVVIAVVIVTVAIAVFHSGGAAVGFLKAIMGIVGKLLGVKATTTVSIITNIAGEAVGIGLISSISIGVSGQIIAGLYAVGALANNLDDKKKKTKAGTKTKQFCSQIEPYINAATAEIERDLISQRTKEALRYKKEQGIKLGRPRSAGKSKLDASARKSKPCSQTARRRNLLPKDTKQPKQPFQIGLRKTNSSGQTKFP